MSDSIGHECGLAMIRLRQPLSYYRQAFGDTAWGLRRLFILMEKQRNRGQDGAGIAAVKFDMPPGEPYLLRIRSDKDNALDRVFQAVLKDIHPPDDPSWLDRTELELKQHCEFLGEVYLGHLRYATHSDTSLANCHPRVRKHNQASRNVAIAGNFNMTNSRELFEQLLEYGLNPVGDSDTQVVLERLGFSLDKEHERLTHDMGPGSFRGLEGRDLAEALSQELNIVNLLRHAAQPWDGGYVFGGVIGNGDAFVCRDPAGIRPAFFYIDDDVVAAASERAALANVFDVQPHEIEPIQPGHVLVIKRDGRIEHQPFIEQSEIRQCSFERIYFSRGNDPDIYNERKNLGRQLAPRVLDAIDHDLERTVFSYIPNTGETAYLGLVEEIDHISRQRKADNIWQRVTEGNINRDEIAQMLNHSLRTEKVAHKDQKLRTFITHDAARKDLVLHIYDITRGCMTPDETLVVVDDSIVRGTTLRDSIVTILSRLNPKKIIIASSSPPIMYPDCYGIDMSQLGRFIAFEAAVALLHENGEEALLDEVEQKCEAQKDLPSSRIVNHVSAIYDRFTLDEISERISRLIRPRDLSWTGDLQVIYQTLDGLHASMPHHTGDWYFTGAYPTPGGFRVLNNSYLQWRKHADVRAY